MANQKNKKTVLIPKFNVDLQIVLRTIYLLREMQLYTFQYFNLI